MWLALLACARTGSLTVVVEADPARTGTDGTDGPYGAAVVERRYAARVTEGVWTRVWWPVDGDGAPAVTGAPAMVLVQGGSVAVDRYDWLASHLATRGYGVVMPEHPFDLAILAVGNAQDAWVGVVGDTGAPFTGVFDPRQPLGVAGHSLGGVVAAMNWVEDERFDAVALLAAYPADGTAVGTRAGSPVLVMVGSDDGASLPTDVEAGFERFGEPRWYGEVEGMNHYAWTDDATEADLAKDGVASRPDAETRPDALNLLDTWMDAVLGHDGDARDRLDAGEFPGVEVSR